MYAQSDMVLLIDISGNFQDKCVEANQFDPVHFMLAAETA